MIEVLFREKGWVEVLSVVFHLDKKIHVCVDVRLNPLIHKLLEHLLTPCQRDMLLNDVMKVVLATEL
jgi:hypothetical protein